MRNIYFIFAFILYSFAASAQPVTHLSENFDAACVTSGGGYVPAWAIFTPIMGTAPQGGWLCTSTNGRDGTPGIQCTDYFSGANHLDTSYLVSPLLDFSSYSAVYLNFDSKVSTISLSGRLEVLVQADTTFDTSGTFIDLTPSLLPTIGVPDSSNWVTHEADLTPYKASRFYVAFRYVSPSTAGNIWYLDNVNTTSAPLSALNVQPIAAPLSLSASVAGNSISLFYSAPEAGSYSLIVYDMMGRTAYSGPLTAAKGNAAYTIDGLDLKPGMFCIKMSNNTAYAVAKCVKQ